MFVIDKNFMVIQSRLPVTVARQDEPGPLLARRGGGRAVARLHVNRLAVWQAKVRDIPSLPVGSVHGLPLASMISVKKCGTRTDGSGVEHG